MDILAIKQNYLPVTPVNVDEIYRRWIEFLDVSEKTRKSYAENVGRFLKWASSSPTGSMDRATVQAYKEELLKTCKPATVNAYLMAVKQFFKWLETEGIYKDVTKGIKAVRLDRGFKKDYLTEDQIRDVLSTIDTSIEQGRRDYAMIALMVTTGLRTVEIERANVEDFCLQAGSMVLYVQGKGHTERNDFVKISYPVEKALRIYLSKRGPLDGKEPLFASCSTKNLGERMNVKSISRIVKTALKKAGLDSDRLTAHSLRHTTATMNLLHGGTIQETQQLLRHESISTTMIYSHMLDKAQSKSEERISQAIFG